MHKHKLRNKNKTTNNSSFSLLKHDKYMNMKLNNKEEHETDNKEEYETRHT